jgi:hypothetical protein
VVPSNPLLNMSFDFCLTRNNLYSAGIELKVQLAIGVSLWNAFRSHSG